TQHSIPTIDIYDLYKPLRNDLRQLDMHGLLTLLWNVTKDPLGGSVFKLQNAFGNAFEIYLWEVHLLAREAVLQAGFDKGLKQAENKDLLKLVNHLRRIAENTSMRTIHSSESAARALHPLIHQQARWQNTREWDRFHRAFRIYGRDDVRPLLETVVGMRLSTIYSLTFAIAGAAARSPRILSNSDYSFMGISEQERDAYFRMVGASLSSIRERIEQRQRYDESWPFTWNPLEGTPLIKLWDDRPDHYFCPFPQLLLRRATDSLFFDLGKSEEKFVNPYGIAFQVYVGDVLRAQFKAPIHQVLEEQTYRVKRNLKHGVDWIVSDPSGHIMFECKTRRLKVDAKAVVDGNVLTDAIEELATIVVQHYKNLHDALQGVTHWKPDGKPVYPIIVTLEDWTLFAPHVINQLHILVHERLSILGFGALLDSCPFIVTSIAEFEQAGQAIAQIGIDKFCGNRAASGNRHFGLSAHAPYAFPDIDIK
ncbi:hypothetical protein AAKU55_005952, partial [Oxalobacteraceae bacterium GrIS 1.11]